MAIYHTSSAPNALVDLSAKDAKTIFDDRVKVYLSTAWELIGERKDILGLYPYLQAYYDNNGHIVRISPIPYLISLGFEITEAENIALAIIENCFYLRKSLDKKIHHENLLCISAACGELYSKLFQIKFEEDLNKEYFAAGYFAANENGNQEIPSELYEYVAERAKKEAAQKAADARHTPLREFKEEAARVAKQEWGSGSNFLHHQMAKYLIEEYKNETGKHPFTCLPDKNKSSPDRVLLGVCKRVAKDMNRPDLISGQKKS